MERCTATTRKGNRCKNRALPGEQYCRSHCITRESGITEKEKSQSSKDRDTWDFKDFNERSAEVSKTLRSWLVAYGIQYNNWGQSNINWGRKTFNVTLTPIIFN